MENSNNITLIEKYLRNELDKTERQNFQKKLKDDKELAEAFEVEKAIFDTVQVKGEKDFRNRLKQIELDRQPTATIKSFNWRPWVIAASILFLIGLSWIGFQQNNSLSTTDLFAENYKAPTFEMARTNVTMPEQVKQAANAYNQHDFETTINYLTPYLENNPDPKLTLLLGTSYLELGQWQAAIDTFNSLKKQKVLADDATWFLGLTYLKMDNKELAKQSFQQLLSNDFSVTPKRKALATDLIKQLGK